MRYCSQRFILLKPEVNEFDVSPSRRGSAAGRRFDVNVKSLHCVCWNEGKVKFGERADGRRQANITTQWPCATVVESPKPRRAQVHCFDDLVEHRGSSTRISRVKDGQDNQ